MSGGHIANFKKLFRLNITLCLLLSETILIGLGYVLLFETNLDDVLILGILGSAAILLSLLFGYALADKLAKPTEYLAQAIFHISPNEHLVAAPNIEDLRFGQELVANLTRQIYDFAATSSSLGVQKNKVSDTEILDSLPVAIIGLDENQNMVLVNKTAQETFLLKDWKNLPLEAFLQLKFNNSDLQTWSKEVQDKSINATNSWQKVEIMTRSEDMRSYFDIAAVYQQKHPSGIQTLIVFFNHNEMFEMEEDALNLISLSVHEIRTPLTILRGYIEVLREELEGKVDAQSKQYIDRLSASSENLAAFMANILSVAKADQNQLTLQLQEASWEQHLTSMLRGMENRAQVRGKQLKLTVAPNLPNVAIDSISINEVITNLIDNAIKYSPRDKTSIYVEANLDKDGSILTTVRDEGVGIPDSVVPNLFNRFYRNRRNRTQVSGTGLGLFISKEIVSAHYGNIWVKSKEGAGTTVGFTLQPFAKLDELQKTSDNGFRQVPHGWIKNHSMQRR